MILANLSKANINLLFLYEFEVQNKISKDNKDNNVIKISLFSKG